MMEMTLTIGALAGAVVAVVTATYLIYVRWIRPVARAFRRWTEFLSDWFGEPARPGHPGRRGVMERLESVEHKAGRAEWHAGNGAVVPMRQVVDAIDQRTADLDARTTYLEATVSQHHPPADESK